METSTLSSSDIEFPQKLSFEFIYQITILTDEMISAGKDRNSLQKRLMVSPK